MLPKILPLKLCFSQDHIWKWRVLVQNTTFKIIFFIKNTNFWKFIFKGKTLVSEWIVTFTHCQWHAVHTCQIQESQYYIRDYFSLTKGMKYFGTGKYRCTISELLVFLNRKKNYIIIILMNLIVYILFDCL